MNKTILILAIIAVLLIAYVALKSEKTTIERSPAVTDTVIVEAKNVEALPVPDAPDEIMITQEELPDPQDVEPIDEEIVPTQNDMGMSDIKIQTEE